MSKREVIRRLQQENDELRAENKRLCEELDEAKITADETSINKIMKTTGQMLLAEYQEHLQQVVVPYYRAGMKLIDLLGYVDILAVQATIPSFRETARERVIGLRADLMACAADYDEKAELAKVSINESLVEVVSTRANAIKNFVSRRDDGQSLQEAIRATGARSMANLLDDYSALDYGGRPVGMSGWRWDLQQKWQELEQAEPDLAAYQIHQRLLDKLKAKRQKTPEERKQYDSLKRAKDPGEYRRKLLNAGK